MNRYARVLTLQTATITDDGLGAVTTWSGTTPVTVTLLPATRSTLERAQLLGFTATHQLLVQRGFGLSPAKHRLLDGATVYAIRDVETGPRYDRILVEVEKP